MNRTAVAAIVGFAALTVLGFVLVPMAPSLGTIAVVAGLVGLVGFLLYGYFIATTTQDQWVWQTPGKPRRERNAEQAKRAAADGEQEPAPDEAE